MRQEQMKPIEALGERGLEQQNALIRATFEGAAIGIALVDLEGRVVESNPALQTMMGYGDDELKGKGFPELTHPDDLALDWELAQEVISARRHGYRIEKRYLRKDGAVVWGRLNISAAAPSGEEPRFVVAMVKDITEHKRAEEQLREAELQYRSIFEATSDAVFINDLQGFVVEANPAACAMHGYSYEEMVGMHRTAYIHPEHHHVLKDYLRGIGENGSFHVRSANVRKDGRSFPVEVHGASFLYKGEPHILGVVRDITQQVQAYELLEQRVEERTRELSTLLYISCNVASTLELQPLLSLILDSLKQVVDYVDSSILLVQGDELVHLDYRGPILHENILYVRVPIHRQGSLSPRLLRGEPVIIDDVRGDSPEARDYWAALGEE